MSKRVSGRHGQYWPTFSMVVSGREGDKKVEEGKKDTGRDLEPERWCPNNSDVICEVCERQETMEELKRYCI